MIAILLTLNPVRFQGSDGACISLSMWNRYAYGSACGSGHAAVRTRTHAPSSAPESSFLRTREDETPSAAR